ncbi:hypothetical protein Dda_1282 [Drechslerella dactyloides]|uniref:Uncharacterized protein n=1 Tax=Drechslerella dactyloides TaxID=74499 RepID=A0AAD6J5X8_DREDA|nr:hypothetical protein Dda_1282 [Drechslerella dactyloides]
MSLLRRPPTKILLTADEVRLSLEQAAKEEELRNLENERQRLLEEQNEKQQLALQAQQQQAAAAEGKKSTRARTRDERIGRYSDSFETIKRNHSRILPPVMDITLTSRFIN